MTGRRVSPGWVEARTCPTVFDLPAIAPAGTAAPDRAPAPSPSPNGSRPGRGGSPCP